MWAQGSDGKIVQHTYFPQCPSGQKRFVCVCDATWDELQVIARIDDRADDLSQRHHAEWCRRQQANSDRALRAAQTRRDNKRKAEVEADPESLFDEEKLEELRSLQTSKKASLESDEDGDEFGDAGFLGL